MRQRCSSCSKRAGQRNPRHSRPTSQGAERRTYLPAHDTRSAGANSACVVVLHHTYEDHWRIEE